MISVVGLVVLDAVEKFAIPFGSVAFQNVVALDTGEIFGSFCSTYIYILEWILKKKSTYFGVSRSMHLQFI